MCHKNLLEALTASDGEGRKKEKERELQLHLTNYYKEK